MSTRSFVVFLFFLSRSDGVCRGCIHHILLGSIAMQDFVCSNCGTVVMCAVEMEPWKGTQTYSTGVDSTLDGHKRFLS
jgi:hypothetical protein